MRTVIKSDKAFASDLNRWIYDEQITGISVANIDCVVSHFDRSGDDVKVIEFKHSHEKDSVMQDVMLSRLADRLKMSNQMSGSKFGVFKIRGELPFDFVELYDYMTGDTRTLNNKELRSFVGIKAK